MQDFDKETGVINSFASPETEGNPKIDALEIGLLTLTDSVLPCKYCQKRYRLIASLKKHEAKCLSNKRIEAEGNHEADPSQFNFKLQENACKQCGRKFKFRKMLQRHEAMHKQNGPYMCKLCFKTFDTADEKIRHETSEHPSKNKKRKCKICPNVNFNSEEEYLYHITELHKGQFNDYYMCSDCGKQFKTKSELTHHIKSKCGTIKLYKCKVCGQDLMTAGSLHNHMLRHSGQRCCMCGYCGKTFVTAGQLKVHERTHTQEKAFVCQVCGKGFCHRQSLITHSSLHTGVKPYQCDNCGHSFSCVGNLMKHRRTHADTCGTVPLTTHRVNNPTTKMKVKINTPKNSKLKMILKEKEMQEKLEAYKKKLITEEEHCPSNSDCGIVLSSQNSICPHQHIGDYDKNQEEHREHLSSKFSVKTENEFVIEDVPYIPNGFLQTKVLELDVPLLDKNCVKTDLKDELNDCTAADFFKHDNDLGQYSNEFTNKQDDEKVTNDIQITSKISLETEPIFNTTHFLSNINDGLPIENANSPSDLIKNMDLNKVEPRDLDDGNHNYSSDGQINDDHCTSDYSDDVKIKITNVAKNKCKRTTPKKKLVYNKSMEKEFQEFLKARGFDGNEARATCQCCQKVYTNLRWLFKHERNHKKKSERLKIDSKHLYRCSCCKIGFETRDECREHQQNMHADVLTCQDCDKLFSNVDSLRSHQNIFHKGLPRKVYVYVCEKCGLQFRQKAFLTHHENSNCGTGPVYECHICGKGFNSVHTRRSHLRIHDPKKRFLCKFCGKSFRWKGQLKIHERSHTGEKPFKCLYCPKAFPYRESLITHSSLHTGIKPHLCQACGSRFSCIGNLIKHRSTHASTCGAWYAKDP